MENQSNDEPEFVRISYRYADNPEGIMYNLGEKSSVYTSIVLKRPICENIMIKTVKSCNGEKTLRVSVCKNCPKCLAASQ